MTFKKAILLDFQIEFHLNPVNDLMVAKMNFLEVAVHAQNLEATLDIYHSAPPGALCLGKHQISTKNELKILN